MTATKDARSRRTQRSRIPQITIPPPVNNIDRLVDALVAAWNRQKQDAESQVFFGPCLYGERHELIDAATRRYAEGVDRAFVRSWLQELARAINGASFRWQGIREGM
jgi:hypothetical protein